MHNKDYVMMLFLALALAAVLAGCAPTPAAHENWQHGWCSPMSGSPQTDL